MPAKDRQQCPPRACSSSKAIRPRPWPSTSPSAAPPRSIGYSALLRGPAAGHHRRYLPSGRPRRRHAAGRRRRWKAMTASPSPAPACMSINGGPEVTPPDRSGARGARHRHAGVRLLLGLAGHHGGRRRQVRKNPKGREIGFGRGIRLTEAGRKHPMYVGKLDVFNAPTVHLDEVEALAAGHDRARHQRHVGRCRAPKSAPMARSPGACSIIRNIRCANWRRSSAASARG